MKLINTRIATKGLLTGMAIFLFGCPDPPSYPEYPIVEFDDFYAVNSGGDEIGYLTIAFTDGDGDIGNDPESGEFNMFVEYWEFNDLIGEWQQPTVAGEPIVFPYIIPDLTPDGKNKALKGTIQIKIAPYYRIPGSPYNDSIRYRIQLIDRSNHKSEWVFTPPIHNGVVVQ